MFMPTSNNRVLKPKFNHDSTLSEDAWGDLSKAVNSVRLTTPDRHKLDGLFLET